MIELRRTGLDLVWLVSCALHGQKPEAQRVREMDLDALYKLSRAQSLGSMTASALLASDALGAEEKLRWKEMRDKAIRKTMLLDAERAQIFSFFEQEGIWHLPLKGVLIKELYPALGMRQMGDNDFLIDGKYRKKTEEFMMLRGYQKGESSSVHDCYIKKPIYNYEMHWSLADEDLLEEKIVQYYADIQQRLQKTDDTFLRSMTQEDHYIYITVHANKHMTDGGTGLRSALDQHVCRNAWTKMNAEYVNRELEELGIAAFERSLLMIAEKLFGKESVPENVQLSEEEEKLLLVMLGSGTYGTLENSVNNRMGKMARSEEESGAGARGKYLRERLFPPMNVMRRRFPVLQRAAWLLPAMYVYRLARSAVKHGAKNLQELRIVMKRKQKGG